MMSANIELDCQDVHMKTTLALRGLSIAMQCFAVSCSNAARDVSVTCDGAEFKYCLSQDCGGRAEAMRHNPDFRRCYEESQWREACRSLSAFASYPAIALLVVPGCELAGYMRSSEEHFF